MEAPKKMGPDALLKDKFKAQRHRTGYEDGISSTHKALPVTAFVLSDNPVPLLGVATRCAVFWRQCVRWCVVLASAHTFLYLHKTSISKLPDMSLSFQSFASSLPMMNSMRINPFTGR